MKRDGLQIFTENLFYYQFNFMIALVKRCLTLQLWRSMTNHAGESCNVWNPISERNNKDNSALKLFLSFEIRRTRRVRSLQTFLYIYTVEREQSPISISSGKIQNCRFCLLFSRIICGISLTKTLLFINKRIMTLENEFISYKGHNIRSP